MSAWTAVPLKRLFNIVNGSTPTSSEPDYWDGDIYWATPEDIGKSTGQWLTETSRKITEEGYQSCGTSMVAQGSLVLTTRAPVGNIVIAGVPLCTNQGCKSLEPLDEEVANCEYFYYLLASKASELNALARGSTFVELGTDQLGAYKVPVPPIVVQRQIVEILNTETADLDALIGEKQRLLNLLAEKRRAVIADSLTKGLNQDAPHRDSEIPWLGEIPAHWQTERAKWLFSERDDRSDTGDEELLTVSHLTGVTSRAEKDVNMFMAESLEGYKRCQAGDLVINTLWAWMGAMGVARQPGIVSPAYNVYQPVVQLDPEYVDLLVRTPRFVEEITRYSKGVWSSRLRLYPAGLYEAWLPVPPLDEQQAIVKHVQIETRKLDALAEATERTIALLQERRSALISATVTGELEIGEATI